MAVSFRGAAPIRLRQYRLALACTGEYGQAKGGTVESVLASMNTALNRVNQVFQMETAIRLQLIENNDQLIFLDAQNDPYTQPRNAAFTINQNITVLNETLGGFTGYDVGHVFTLGCDDSVAGTAARSSACTLNKGAGITCHFTDNVEFIAIEVMAHEIGHQFGCFHTWNNCPNFADQYAPADAYEPGSGSTIMSYAGACGSANNITNQADDYYHAGSLEDFIAFSRQGEGATCGTLVGMENNRPEVVLPYSDGFFIPRSTFFELEAIGSDPDGGPITYCWEQYDTGPSGPPGSPEGTAPLFRTFPPTESPLRVFPRLGKILSNNFDNTEVLPSYGRRLRFRCTVRDNHPEAGGVAWAQVEFRADSESGPFQVITPNTADISWTVGSYQEINWDVANTDNDRVNCQKVNILLSTNGGNSFPITLLEGTDNDGTAFITVPDAVSSQARIRIEAADNIFFDLSDRNFSIEAATAPGFALELAPQDFAPLCLPEPAIIDIQSSSILGFDSPISLELVGELPAGAFASFGQNTLNPGESTTLTLSFTEFLEEALNLEVQATAEGVDTALRNLQLTTVSNDFSDMALTSPEDGRSDIVLSSDFDWEPSADANTYDFQLASSASFTSNSIVESAEGLTESAFESAATLEDSELYFWRVRPVNECGPGPWLPAYVFQTAEVVCNGYTPTDLPINLPTAVNTKTSKLMVEDEGIIADVNISNLEIRFAPVNSLRITLVSPAGTEAVVYNRACLNTNQVELTLDDEAPEDIPCPPTDFQLAQPDNPLSVFDGESTAGEWQLRVEVVASGFTSGSIRSWQLDFCAAGGGFAPPTLLTNEPLAVPPGEGTTITPDFLEAQDESANATQLTYTILSPPAHGILTRWSLGDTLGQGDKFSQATINTFNLGYIHDGSDTQSDSFTFFVENGFGGFTPGQAFTIIIDEDAMVSTEEAAPANSLRLFPNPAREELNLQFERPVSGPVTLRLLSLQGREVRQQRFDESGSMRLNLSGLPAGIYLVQVQTAKVMFTEKVMVGR